MTVDVTKPCEFMGLGAMDVAKSHELAGFVEACSSKGLPASGLHLIFGLSASQSIMERRPGMLRTQLVGTGFHEA